MIDIETFIKRRVLNETEKGNMIVEKDKTKIRISDLLKSHPEGLTITEIMEKTGLARHTVLARLHGLIGGDKVGVRKINMAKLHSWKSREEEEMVEQGERVKLVELEEKNIKKKPKEVVKKISEKKPAEEGLDTSKSQKSSVQKIPENNRNFHASENPNKLRTSVRSETQGFSDFDSARKSKIFDMSQVKAEIDAELKGGKLKKHEAQILEQRTPILRAVNNLKEKQGKTGKEHIKTGIPGFDELFERGIPRGNTTLVAGGAGSGKTIFCLQLIAFHASQGEKCFYMSFEESETRLIEHMEGFGWNPKELIEKGKLKIQRMNPFEITRNVDALLAKEKGELLIDIDPIIMPAEFKPDFVVIDSLTAIASAFTVKEDSYRVYVEQLFRFFEKIRATTFLITETTQIPEIFSTSGVEEFLADGVIVLYNIKKGNIRESAIEILKMRGEKHKKKVVAMTISDSGITVYPEQEVFGWFEERK